MIHVESTLSIERQKDKSGMPSNPSIYIFLHVLFLRHISSQKLVASLRKEKSIKELEGEKSVVKDGEG